MVGVAPTMRSLGTSSLLILSSLLFPSPALAEDDEVLVRGQQATGFVSRADLATAPREITDAASLVEPLPGVHVRRLGADDSFATLSIRGSSSTQVAVYLAGVPLSGGADPTLDLATLPLWPGARATVHRSFAPASLGRGSLGGTMVIDPPNPRAPEGTDLWMAAGSYGSRRLRLGDVRSLTRESAAQGSIGGARVATGVSASRSDDDFSYLDPDATLAAGRDVETVRRNAGHAAAAGLVSVALPLRVGTRDGALTITELVQARRQQLPGSIRLSTPFQRLESSRMVSALELSLPITGSATFIARTWGRREGLALFDRPDLARREGSPSETDDIILAVGGSSGVKVRPSDVTTIEARVDGSSERFLPGSWVGALAPPSARRTNGGLGIDAMTRLHALSFAASGRADVWLDSGAGASDKVEAKPTGHVGVEIPLGPVLLASHGGFVARPPSFVELYGNRGAFVGNLDLRSESAWSVDAGGRFTRRFGPLRVDAEVALFATWASDLITFVYFGRSSAQARNIGEARLAGVEGMVRAAVSGLELRASHTALDSVNESECGSADCPPLPGRPQHDFVGDLSFERGPIRVRYGVDVASGLVADVRGTIRVPARALHGVSLRVALPRLRKAWATIDVRNLLDSRVGQYAGVDLGGAPSLVRAPLGDLYEYPLPGRRFLLSLHWLL